MNKKCFIPADIMLPQNCDMSKWSVVACDQYTSQPEYWREVSEYVGDAPSTLNITFPEIFLDKDDKDCRIEQINKTMCKYEKSMKVYKNAMILVERTLSNGKKRLGIVGAADLEAYDFSVGSDSLIRATEGTVLDRIPPRVKIRENAPMELPHIMLLADDPQKTVIEPVYDKRDSFTCIYDFELMQGGGHIKGYLIPEIIQEQIIEAYTELADFEKFNKKYSLKDCAPLLFAMGDGNHSLATAKTCFENLKKKYGDKALSMPARYALCELVNLHDDSLEFEAIHRVLFGVNKNDILNKFKIYCAENDAENDTQEIMCYFDGGEEKITVKNPPATIAAGTLQRFLDEYIAANNCKIDYIHGADVTRELGSKPGNIGFVLPAMSKDELFKSVASDGVLPRKTFSMGEACDKRFYLEARKIL